MKLTEISALHIVSYIQGGNRINYSSKFEMFFYSGFRSSMFLDRVGFRIYFNRYEVTNSYNFFLVVENTL